jgi:hypothetical protein
MPKTAFPFIILSIREQKLIDIIDINSPTFSLNIYY